MTAEKLAQLISGAASRHRITLVAPKTDFTFYPALVRLAFGDCEAVEIKFDLIEKLDEIDVRFVQGEAININTNQKRVRIAGDDFDGEIVYDYLVIAAGRRLATEKIGGFFEHAHHLLGVDAALKFGAAIKTFERGRIVVGLAPDALLPVPVCETAFALARRFAGEIERGEISVQIVFPESVEQAFGGADLHRKLEDAFAAHRVRVVKDFPAHEVEEKALISEDGKRIEFDLLMLAPPFRGRAMHGETLPLDEFDFIETDDFMRVKDVEKTYAAGDITAFPGPKLAFMAIRQAQTAAENIASELRGDFARKIYSQDLAVIIDEGGEDALFLHYGIWDDTVYGLKTGKMWSRMKKTRGYLWGMMRDS
jgi:sulfide:quinone oxidoreductase